MKSNLGTATATIIRTALVIGAVTFVVGFVMPLFFSTSNLGPMFGIMISGPVGTLAGALLGIVRATRSRLVQEERTLLRWLLVTWAGTLIYTLLTISLAPKLALPAIALQLAVLGVTAFVVGPRQTFRSSSPIILVMMIVIATMTVFPPVVRPSWTSAPQSAKVDVAPRFAAILDRRLSAARHEPELVIRTSALVLEWLVVSTIGAVIAVVRARTHTSVDAN